MVCGFSSVGCGGHKYRRDVSDHWWHHLRDWSRFLQAKKLQCKNRNGISHCHTLFTCKRSFKKRRKHSHIYLSRMQLTQIFRKVTLRQYILLLH